MSSRGFLIYAEGPEYVKQAYLCALSIVKNKNTYPVSIVTNSDASLYKHLFDEVITLPDVQTDESSFKTEGRKHLYEVSPYKETIVLDSDVLVLENLDYLWNLMSRDVYYPDTAFTYRGEKITNNFYRKAFVYNNLPNCYNAFFFFRKSSFADEFYNMQKEVASQWQKFYDIWCKAHKPAEPSMDIITAITHKILDYSNTNNRFPNLVHMKPAIQNWEKSSDSWLSVIGVFLNVHAHLKIGNYRQSGVFHYTDNNFVTDDIIRKFENAK